MRAKLIKTATAQRGKMRGKVCYEYGLHSNEELNAITRQYTEMIKEQERIRLMNPHRRYGPLPRLIIPKLNPGDVDDCEYHHKSENVIQTVYKHNGNIQVYVQNPKGQEPEPLPIVADSPEVPQPSSMVNCPKCGKEIKPRGLKGHLTRWCKGEAA